MRLAVVVVWAAVAGGAVAAPMEKIACLGDSIVRGDTTHEEEPSKNKRDRGNYPLLLGDLLGVDVRNFGSSGVTAHAGKRHYPLAYRAYDAAVAFAPDTVIVLLGVNDAKPTGDWAWDFNATEFVAGYLDLLARFRDDVPGLERAYVVARLRRPPPSPSAPIPARHRSPTRSSASAATWTWT